MTGIDVVIPVYNGDKYIRQALDSVVRQTLKPDTVIVVDDGSTDNTSSIVKDYDTAVNIKYIYQRNAGLSAARNTGIISSSAEYIAFLDADDEWYLNKLALQAKVFEMDSEKRLGLVYCGCEIVDERGSLINIFPFDVSLKGFVFEKLLEANKVVSSGSGVLVRRECFDSVGLFDENLRAFEDWDMWLRISSKYEIDFVTDTVVKIRKHANNMQDSTSFMYENSLKFYDKWSIATVDLHYDCTRWRDSIIHKIVEHLPCTSLLKIAQRTLSEPAKKQLFKSTHGSLELCLLLNIKAIVGCLMRRMLCRCNSV